MTTAKLDEKEGVIDQFFGDASCPIEWEEEAAKYRLYDKSHIYDYKKLHFWFDDLHVPYPVSPMYFDLGDWAATCNYMYRRFGAPFGKDWVAKKIGGYYFSAVVPRDPKDAADIAPYFNMVMPVYAKEFLGWWKERLLPELLRNFEYLDNFDMENATLPEMMILLEDMIDILERHFRLHWVLNLAQFQSTMDFGGAVAELIGPGHDDLVGRIMISDEDRNWDSINELWKMKEIIKATPVLMAAFKKPAEQILAELALSAEGKEMLKKINAFAVEYGNKAMYTHEFVLETWRENPLPFVSTLKGYVETDYNAPEVVRNLRENRAKAIEELWALFPASRSQADRDRLQNTLDLALKMTPLTPDHHFYMDQGTQARTRIVLLGVGKKLVKAGVIDQADDVIYMEYDELRKLSANFKLFDAKALVKKRRAEREEAFKHPPILWAGTIDHWSLYEEPYKAGLWGWPGVYLKQAERAKQPKGTLVGLGVSRGVAEGVARVVTSPAQFDEVQKGEILVCVMTNPAWVVLFTKLAGLITDSGGALSHPAVISREFEIPAVVGTFEATQKIKTGQRVRVNGTEGTVQILD